MSDQNSKKYNGYKICNNATDKTLDHIQLDTTQLGDNVSYAGQELNQKPFIPRTAEGFPTIDYVMSKFQITGISADGNVDFESVEPLTEEEQEVVKHLRINNLNGILFDERTEYGKKLLAEFK